MKKISTQQVQKENSIFQDIVFKYLPYWPLFLTLLLLCAGGLFVFLKLNTPLYETTASILIKDGTKGQEDSKMEEVLNLFGTKKTVENETQILSSNEIVGEVIKKLYLYSPVNEETGWKGLKVTSAYYSSPFLVEAADINTLKESKKIYFTFPADKKSVLINGKNYPLNQWVGSPWGKIRFINNPKYKAGIAAQSPPGSKLYFSFFDINKITKLISKNLVVSPVSRQSSVINMKVRDEIPQRGEEILTSLVDAYNKAAIYRKNSVALKTLEFIESRLKNVSDQLDSVESGIQSYRDRSGIVDITEQSRLYLESIEANDRQMNELNMQLSSLEEVEKYLESKSKEGSLVPSTINIADPTLTQLITKLSTAESQYETLKKTTAENNPILQSLQEDIAKTKPNILENIRSQKKNLLAGKTYLDKINNRYSSMLNTIPKKERELVDVSRQQNIKNDIYKFLLEKREETAYSMSSALPDCFLVDQPATSLFPVTPKIPLLALLAGIFPFIIGVSLISIKDAFNNKIMYRKEIEELTNFPIIGELLFEKLDTNLVTSSKERSFLQEQFRQIRAALKYQGNPPGNQKRIMVTSSIKGEGKSFVSANLAVSLSKSGKKVALLELDLHQPKLTDFLEIEKSIGITDYLLGNSTESEIIIPTSINPNLSILQAGYLVEDPSELLLNERLEMLLNYLDKVFDVIIIDTAPVFALTDAMSIAPHVNLILYIIRHNHTPKAQIQMLNENMESFKINNIAIIFNGVKNRGYGRYSYGNGYGYGYDSKSSYDEYGKKKKQKVA